MYRKMEKNIEHSDAPSRTTMCARLTILRPKMRMGPPARARQARDIAPISAPDASRLMIFQTDSRASHSVSA